MGYKETKSGRKLPGLAGLKAGISSFKETCRGANLTDRLALAGVILIFPEFERHSNDMLYLITLGHQIDHYFDSVSTRTEVEGTENRQALQLFNIMFPDLLRNKHDKPQLITNMLGFFTQAIMVEKEHRSKDAGDIKVDEYREIANAIWVRMAVSYGRALCDQGPDEAGFKNFSNYNELKDYYGRYIGGADLSNVPDPERNYLLFLWTMATQIKFDEMSRRRNNLNGNTSFVASDNKYLKTALRSGANPLIIKASLFSLDLLPYLQELQ